MNRLCFFSNSWGSGEIRAKQVASRLDNAVCDPDRLHVSDIVIMVKGVTNDDVYSHVSKVYVDCVDSHGVFEWLRTHDRAGIISIGDTHERFMRLMFPDREVVKIPEHHCNFERALLPERPVKTVGFIGDASALQCDVDKLATLLKSCELDFKYATEFNGRQSVIDFYKDIDIAVSLRIDSTDTGMIPQLKNPLKLANAGSFGIPSVCYPEMSSCEFSNAFIPALNIDELVDACYLLASDKEVYESYSKKALDTSENYHIERVVKYYEKLR